MSREKKRDPWLPHRLDNLVRVRQAEARIETAADAMLAEWLPAAHAAVMGPWEALTAAADPPSTPPNPDNIDRADAALQTAFFGHLSPVLLDVFGERFAQVCRDATISDLRYREAYAARTTLRITRISHTVRHEIRDLVTEAVGKGYSMQAVAKGVSAALTHNGPSPRYTMFAEAAREETDQAVRRLRSLMAVPLEDRDAKWREQLDEVRALRQRARQDRQRAQQAANAGTRRRALTIARTEVMAALNGGTLAGMRARSAAMGEPMEKFWLATPDERTRASHRDADGQRVALDQPFHVGGSDLDHPGDPDGAADEVINCRCCMLEMRPGEDAPRNPLTDRAVRASGQPTSGRVDTITSDRRGGTVTARTRATTKARITEFTAPAPADAPAAPAAPANPALQPWTGVLAVEGKPTGDGRQFDADALTWRMLPLPLMFQPKTGEWGHSGSYPVGRIDTISRDGELIRATGVLLPPNPADPDDPIQALLTLLQNGVRVGPSVDLDDMVIEFPDGPVMEGDDFADTTDEPDVMRITAGRIIAATVVATPAFAEVAIQLGTEPATPADATDSTATTPAAAPGNGNPATPNEGPAGAAASQAAATPADAPADAPAADQQPEGVQRSDGTAIAVGDEVLAIVGEGDQARPVEATVTAVDSDAGTVDLQCSDGTTATVPADSVWPDPDGADDQQDNEGGQGQAPVLASVASVPVLLAAAPVAPPREWFDTPEADGPTPFTITDDGRVFGHLAAWGTCHTGFADTCVTPPREQSFDYFHVGEVLTREGDRLATGRVTLGGGHADPKGGYRYALEHYDNAGACAADVVATAGKHGIWLAGALRSTVDDEQLRALRAAPLSGDWRRIGGQLRLMGALAVNLPGFPIPRPKIASVGGVQVSLAAAGVVARPADMPTGEGLTASAVLAEVRAALGRARQAQQLAASIGRTPAQRMAELVASVRGVA